MVQTLSFMVQTLRLWCRRSDYGADAQIMVQTLSFMVQMLSFMV